MKKRIGILSLLCVMVLQGYSQGIRFGVFVEPKFNWLTPDVSEFSNEGTRMGFNVGLIMDNYFTENYAFATGVSINNVGGNLLLNEPFTVGTHAGDSIDLMQGTTVSYRLQYVNIPLGLKLKTNPIGFLSFTSNLGFTPQVNVRGLLKSADNNIENENIINEINLFNLGYHIGAGIEYSLGGNSAISASIIYTNGFMDITKREEDAITMSNVALKIGLMF